MNGNSSLRTPRTAIYRVVDVTRFEDKADDATWWAAECGLAEPSSSGERRLFISLDVSSGS